MTDPERIHEHDLAYHRKVMKRVRDAHRSAQKVVQLQKEAAELQQQVAETDVEARAWAKHLHEEYKLDVERGERVEEDGKIVRVVKPNRAARRARPKPTGTRTR